MISSSCALFLLLLLCGTLHGLAEKGKNPPPSLMQEDLELIKCDVCEKLAEALVDRVESFAAEKAPLPIREFEVIEIMENICKTNNATGHWIRTIDIVESKKIDPASGAEKTYLDFAYPGGISKCNSECMTIAKSCQMLMDDIDPDDLSVLLYKKRPSVSELQKTLCQKMSKRCKGAKKEVPKKYKRREIYFVPMSEKDMQMEELIAKMNQMGMRGSLKEREEIDSMLEEFRDMEDPYEGFDAEDEL